MEPVETRSLPRGPCVLLAAILAACGGGGGGGGEGSAAGGAGLVVSSVNPPDGAEGVPSASAVVPQFRTDMAPSPLESGALLLTPSGTLAPVSATVTVSLDLRTATLTPRQRLEGGRYYQVLLGTAAVTAGGKPLRRPWHSEFRVEAGGGGGGGGSPVQTGTVRPTGDLERGRSGHAAAALSDGRVAVFGGFATDASVTGSIESYDPDTGLWTTAGATLSPARARLTATALPSGLVLLAGGETAGAASIGEDRWELYDPVLDAVVASGTLQERRTGHQATLLADGRVLIAGGSRTDSPGAPNYSRTSAEVFDPGPRTTAALPAMAVARAGHRATMLGDGRVLVTGGHGTDAKAEVFDPVAGNFALAGTMTTPRREHTATLLSDGSVLVAGGGGFTAERWIPSETRFLQVQNLGDVRSLHTAIRLPNGRVFVAGGEKPGPGAGTIFHVAIEFYSPPTISFLYSGLQLLAPRSGHTATVLPDGEVLIVGGKHPAPGANALRSCDRVHLDP